MMEEDDILLIAGKGHEEYQEIKGIKYPFNDKKVILEIIEKDEEVIIIKVEGAHLLVRRK